VGKKGEGLTPQFKKKGKNEEIGVPWVDFSVKTMSFISRRKSAVRGKRGCMIILSSHLKKRGFLLNAEKPLAPCRLRRRGCPLDLISKKV